MKPFVAVVVAVPVMLSASALRPPANVEVAVLPTFKRPLIVVDPVFETAKSVDVADGVELEIWKSVVSVSPLFAAIPNLLVGDVVPMPMVPEVGSFQAVDVAGSVPKRMPPILSI